MKISFRLFANLRSFSLLTDGCGELDLAEESTVRTVSDVLGIPPETERVILLNGHHAKEDTRLSEGDSLTFFPPLTGG
ncbi:MAG: MoaD/ThiS family protein [Deltaproteobacteria bacterium]|nr:MoaD/ThiS family protein [Deltaproteobacteria bacterium]